MHGLPVCSTRLLVFDTMKQIKTSIVLPVETQVREMDAKLLLACVAAERGHRSYIGFQNEIRAKINNIPAGVFIAKGFASRKARFLRILKRLGFTVLAWDEEGLVHPPADIYGKRRISAESLFFLEGIFSWGADYTELLKGLSFYDGTAIYQEGNPRLDLLRAEIRHFYDAEVASLRRKYGRYILLNSNFGRVNSAIKRRRDEGVAGPGSDPDLDRKWLNNMDYRRTLYEHFRGMLSLVAEKFPEYRVVLRPHPAERLESWRDIEAQHKNLHVLFEGNVIPWLLGAEILVHNGCTTAIESVLLGKPAVCYQPIAPLSEDWHLPNSISHQAMSDRHLIDLLRSHLDAHSRLAVTGEQRRLLDSYVDIKPDRLSSDRIIDVMEKLGSAKAAPSRYDGVLGRADARLRAAQKKLRSIIPGDIYSPWHQEKQFPKLAISDVEAMIDRFRKATGRFSDVRVSAFATNVFMIEG